MKRVIAFGEALIDFLPVSNELPFSEVEAFSKSPGGAVANVAVAIAKLGGESYFVGQLGADAFGDFLIQTMEEYGVNTTYSFRTSKARTGVVFLSQEPGECMPYRHPSADMLIKPEDINGDWFKDSGIFHFGSDTLIYPDALQATLRAIDYAKKNQMIISFDINLRPGLWKDKGTIKNHLQKVLTFVDILKINDFEFDSLSKVFSNESIIEYLLEKGVSLIIRTNGEKQTEYFTKDLHGTVEVNGVTPVHVLGAGDAFVGGLLYKLSIADIDQSKFLVLIKNKDELEDYIGFANKCGAWSTQKKGTMPSFPTINSFE